MKVALHIEYLAQWGAEIVLYTGTKILEGNPCPAYAIQLDNDGKGNWFTEVEASMLQGETYHYALVHEHRIVRTEWGKGHVVKMPEDSENIPTYRIWNYWLEQPHELAFHTPGFTKGIFYHSVSEQPLHEYSNTLTFRCEAPSIPTKYVLAIIGNIPELGAWNPANAVIMQPTDLPYWQVSIGCNSLHYPLYYKFVLLDARTHEFVAWEDRPNRYFEPSAFDIADALLIDCLYFANPLPNWQGRGIQIDLNLLRSINGAGIAEFADIPKLIDWMKDAGMNVLCIQPVNDCGLVRETQRVVSGFALDIRYLSLEKAGILKDKEKQKYFAHRCELLNAQPRVRLSEITALKGQYMIELFAQTWRKTQESSNYQKFWNENKSWLEPYSEFLSKRSVTEDGCEELFLPANYFCFVQYHLLTQLQQVRDYARKQGILLAGTTPSGYFRNSADVEIYRQFFDLGLRKARSHIALERQKRQIHPTYNWFALENNNFDWLAKRLQVMSKYFDACCANHFLGEDMSEKCFWQRVALQAMNTVRYKTDLLIYNLPVQSMSGPTKTTTKNWWEIKSEIIQMFNGNKDMMFILPYEQWMSLAESATQRPQTIEQLADAKGLNEIIKQIILTTNN